MKAVFLDKGAFLDRVDLSAPEGVTDYEVYEATKQEDSLIIERCQDADIIITNKVQITKDIIHALPKLKLVQVSATGVNNIDREACQARGIEVYNVAGYAVKSVPEHTFMLMLTGMRAGLRYHERVIDGTWQASNQFCMLDIPIHDLEGRTLGIIGVGTVGKRVSEIAKVFGMRVLWAERQGRSPRSDDYTDFEEVLATADVISLHCPLTDATEHLINADTLAKMDKAPLIVNVARGGVVETQAMADAVTAGLVMGYVTDVFAQEPISDDDPLLALAQANHPRVMFSPHNAWGSVSAHQELWDILSQQVSLFVGRGDW